MVGYAGRGKWSDGVAEGGLGPFAAIIGTPSGVIGQVAASVVFATSQESICGTYAFRIPGENNPEKSDDFHHHSTKPQMDTD